MNRLVVIIIIIIFAGSASVAQYRSNSYNSGSGVGIGPQLGYYKSSGSDNGRLMYGLALRAKLSEGFGLEGSINYRQEKYANGDLVVRSWPVMVSALIYPLPMLYGNLGAGWYNTTFDYSSENITEDELEDQTKQLFGWHLGGGVELPVGESTRLTGDIRYVFLDYKVRQLGETQVEDIKSNFYAITVGFLFGF